MNEKDIQTQLEAIQKELQEAKQQMAATVALNERHGHRSKAMLTPMKWRGQVLALIIVFLLVVGTMLIMNRSEKTTIETGSFIEQIKDLSSLATSQAYVKAVIEKEDNQLFGKEISTNIPGTKRNLLLLIPGTVTAGVDLAKLNQKNLQIDEDEKTIKISLPHADIIQEPTLDFEKAQVFSVEGIFRDEVNWEEGYELAEEAKGLVRTEAISQGLIEIAEKNAERTLTEFFSALGYKTVVEYE